MTRTRPHGRALRPTRPTPARPTPTRPAGHRGARRRDPRAARGPGRGAVGRVGWRRTGIRRHDARPGRPARRRCGTRSATAPAPGAPPCAPDPGQHRPIGQSRPDPCHPAGARSTNRSSCPTWDNSGLFSTSLPRWVDAGTSYCRPDLAVLTRRVHVSACPRALSQPEFRLVFAGVSSRHVVPDTVVVRLGRLLLAPEGASSATGRREHLGGRPTTKWTTSRSCATSVSASGESSTTASAIGSTSRSHTVFPSRPRADVLSPRKHLVSSTSRRLQDRLSRRAGAHPSDLVEYAYAWPGQCRGDGS